MENKDYNNQFSKEEIETEIWKDIYKFKGFFQISSLGRVKSLSRYYFCGIGNKQKMFLKERLKNPSLNSKNYYRVNLTNDKTNYKTKWFFIHSLVLETFVGKRKNNEFCRHLDGNKNNNRLTNLCYGTASENQRDRIKCGTYQYGENNPFAKLDNEDIFKIRELNKKGFRTRSIAVIFNISYSHCINIISRKVWTHI